tara:strand:- start:269 stop:625 length:357 start_codon:yes stop_codon:yes gene_type:complete
MIANSSILYTNLDIFIFLALGHFLGDFGLQSDRMAIEKCPGKDVTLNWRWWLISHGAIHGFIVAIITGIPLFGLIECIFHSIIDFGKCRFGYSLLTDQILHLVCKFFYLLFLRSIILF